MQPKLFGAETLCRRAQPRLACPTQLFPEEVQRIRGEPQTRNCHRGEINGTGIETGRVPAGPSCFGRESAGPGEAEASTIRQRAQHLADKLKK